MYAVNFKICEYNVHTQRNFIYLHRTSLCQTLSGAADCVETPHGGRRLTGVITHQAVPDGPGRSDPGISGDSGPFWVSWCPAASRRFQMALVGPYDMGGSGRQLIGSLRTAPGGRIVTMEK